MATSWDTTGNGQNANNAFNSLLDAIQNSVPNYNSDLDALANRPIEG